MAKKEQRIQDLVGLLHRLYDPALAEEWDNVGLQVGEPAAPVNKVMVALDPTAEALAAAAASGAKALITHHPLIFKPLKRLSPEDATGRVIWTAIRSGVAIVCAHTNLDCAAQGLNVWLAESLGLQQAEPLQPSAGDFLKLVVYVPADHADSVADALFSAGAGQVGAYDHCSFRVAGTGTFRPGAGTDPYLGTVGQDEAVAEVRLETIVAKRRLHRALEKMSRAHPYEEVAYDLVPLQNAVPGAGLGRIGRLAEPTTLAAYAGRVKTALGCAHLRVVGAEGRKVSKVAVCGGSGAGLVAAAHRQGADLLVTGDAKYHDARQAEELGIGLIDAGHFDTEKIMVAQVAEVLQAAADKQRWEMVFERYSGEQEPFRVY